MKWLHRHYGAGPLHLIALPACLAFSGYLVMTVLPAPRSILILIWFAGAAVAHDLILWPLYAIIDRAAVRRNRRHPTGLPVLPWTNYVRVPAVLSGVMLAVSFPLVLRLAEPTYRAATGLTEYPYLARWLALTAAAFTASAVVYAVRLARIRRRARSTP